MNCPRCRTAHPPFAKFCMNCGAVLALACANCQAELPPGARFCLHCGQPAGATTPSEDTRLARLATAAPAPLVTRLSGERKVVTVLFADVVGSTALAEQMDAEDWTLIMNGAFDLISPAIYRYEGTIARLLGDALLAFFGAPVAHEDDPVRAVHAALEILAAVRTYAAGLQNSRGIPFAMRVGLNTGPVVVGNVGSDLKYEYTAMGDAVNLAARLQSAARPMTVLISENTYRFVAPVFDCRDLGPIDVKGKSEPVRVYEVEQPKAAPRRLRGLPGLGSAMVGRAAELSRLLPVSRAVQDGQGRVVLITGEPGIGKSRLIAEWQAAVAAVAPSFRWVTARCLSYGQHIPYHLLIDLLRVLIDVPETAGDAVVRQALSALTTRLLGSAAPEVYPFLAHLLSLPLENPELDRVRFLEPQGLQQHYLAAFQQLLTASSAQQSAVSQDPLALVLDDIHWADPSSVELLLNLIPLAAGAPILFCLATRPDQATPGWKLVTALREHLGSALVDLTLAPLSEADSTQLVSNLLEFAPLLPFTRTLIFKKAEGNPLFVEEVIRMLIDRGALIRQGDGWAAGREVVEVEIPGNLQGLLLARIDHLPEDARRSLRVAAVIGRQFSTGLLAQVLGRSIYPDLLDDLRYLELAGLIQPVVALLEPEYLFRHALIQDAAYASLLKSDRKRLHLAVATTLEALYPARLEELAPLLGKHYYEAADPRAVKYLFQVGARAKQQYANEEALVAFTQALELLQPGDASIHFDILSMRHGLLAHIGRVNEAEADLRRMLDLARQMHDDQRLADALNGLANLCMGLGQLDEVGIYLAEAIEIKRRLNDDIGVADGLTNLASFYLLKLDSARAGILNEEALLLRGAAGDRAGETRNLFYRGLIAYLQGQPYQARDSHQRALELTRQIGDRRQEVSNLVDLGRDNLCLGNYAAAREYLDLALALSREIGDRANEAWALFRFGELDIAFGQLAAARVRLAEVLQMMVEIAQPLGQVNALCWLGWIAMQLGDFPTAMESFDHMVRANQDINLQTFNTMQLACRALIAAQTGDPAVARTYAARAQTLLAEDPIPVYAAQVRQILYLVFRMIDPPAANQWLEASYQWLMGKAAEIPDQDLRTSYLHAHPFNRDIWDAWHAGHSPAT
ncbi:MAG: tetratricopeptide repeat protein [Chloroflexi bacterium]|nr:tetratricopeptide repeat protein [Chloroflexota bacterium]